MNWPRMIKLEWKTRNQIHTLTLCFTLTTNTLDIHNSQLNRPNVPNATLVPDKCTQNVIYMKRYIMVLLTHEEMVGLTFP